MQVWAEPFTRLRTPKLFNLRTDPYEFADVTSSTYYGWFIHNAYFIYAAQTGAAMFAASFKDLPPIQRPGSFTIDDAIAKWTTPMGRRSGRRAVGLKAPSGSASHRHASHSGSDEHIRCDRCR